jgi:hypothetical protein
MAKMSKFQKLSNKIAETLVKWWDKKKANAIAASIGHKKYGGTAFQEWQQKESQNLKLKNKIL